MRTSVFAFFVLCCLLITKTEAQNKITFPASDQLTVTADFYENEKDGKNATWVLLFHQAGYSRGEYRETAARIVKLGYNCLAVDLRSGQEVNFVTNETAKEAKKKKISSGYLDAKKDILAAIEYAFGKSNKPVILFGSSYSASLALVVAKSNSKVKSVVAFSPGEYFENALNVQNSLTGYDKPIFAAVSKKEYPYLETLLSGVTKNKTLFQPQSGDGEHGSKALWKANKSHSEYWMALISFLKAQLK